MITTMRWVGLSIVLALAAVTPAGAQQHDMSKMGKDTAMKHDMSGMGKGMSMKNEMGGMGMQGGWGELNAFHGLLMATWHPAQKDSLGPARALAPALVTVADAWIKSQGPAGCDDAAARTLLPGIVADVGAYASAVAKKAGDAEVKAALSTVHDGFEKVAMSCMMRNMKDMKH